jgi:hypothetical protein
MKQYVQADLDADRQVAQTLAELIVGGSLASVLIEPTAARPPTKRDPAGPRYKSVYKQHAEGPFRDRKRPSDLQFRSGGRI